MRQRGGVDVESDSQVIRYIEVGGGEMVDGDAGGADEVEGVAMGVGGGVHMLGEIEGVEQIQEIRCLFAGGVVNVKVEVSKQQDRG